MSFLYYLIPLPLLSGSPLYLFESTDIHMRMEDSISTECLKYEAKVFRYKYCHFMLMKQFGDSLCSSDPTTWPRWSRGIEFPPIGQPISCTHGPVVSHHISPPFS